MQNGRPFRGQKRRQRRHHGVVTLLHCVARGDPLAPLTSPKQRNIWGVPDVFLRCRRRRVPQTGFRGICRGGRQAQRGSFDVSASRTGRRHARLLEAFDRDGRPAPLARRSSVSQKGPRRAPDKSWPVALSREELTSAVHDNLKHLGLETLDVVNLRVGGLERPTPGSIAEPFTVLAELRRQGLIRHLGVSNVSAEQLTEARSIAQVVCVQNNYNVATRNDRELVDRCAREGIAYTPFFPLGGFTPLQSAVLVAVAARLGASPRQVALAWLLQHSATILLIPGTSSVAHLRENIAATNIKLPADAVDELDRIGAR